uniref:Pyrin-like n=1 Tax=Fundulus heteroclitus TaxID=8078 RepID=A0A3Q2PHS2_FUNHE
MTSLKEDLWKTLEDLTEEEFKKFKWLLKDAGNDCYAIPAARLEKADRPDTVDLVVQRYNRVKSLRMSAQLLEKIGRNDLAQRLSNTSSAETGPRIIGGGHSDCDSEKQKARLRETKAEIRLKIQERQIKINEIKRSAELSRKTAERQTAESLRAFTVFIQSVEKSLSDLTEAIEEKQKTAQRQAEELIQELEQEISELSRREAEPEHPSFTEDNQKFLRHLETSNRTAVAVPQTSYGESVWTSVEKLKEILNEEMEKLLGKAKLIGMQQFAVDVTLDPNTAHPNLVLTQDAKQVHCGAAKLNVPDNPERFDTAVNVLGRPGFSSGKAYFEVQVRGKTAWDLGVVYKSISRKGSVTASPDGGHWTVCLRGGDTFKARGLQWSVKAPLNKVGVFVDYERGSIRFYDADSAEVIHRFSDCSFTETLYPFFSPGVGHGGLNSTPLVISPLSSAA